MANMNIRLGKVSSIDYENGMISVTYPDLDDSVSDMFPVFSFTDEYKMPRIGKEVLVLHLSNGQSAGVVLGKYWNKDNKPSVSGEKMFRKELSSEPGEAYIQYEGESIIFHDPMAHISLADILHRLKNLEQKI